MRSVFLFRGRVLGVVHERRERLRSADRLAAEEHDPLEALELLDGPAVRHRAVGLAQHLG